MSDFRANNSRNNASFSGFALCFPASGEGEACAFGEVAAAAVAEEEEDEEEEAAAAAAAAASWALSCCWSSAGVSFRFCAFRCFMLCGNWAKKLVEGESGNWTGEVSGPRDVVVVAEVDDTLEDEIPAPQPPLNIDFIVSSLLGGESSSLPSLPF